MKRLSVTHSAGLCKALDNGLTGLGVHKAFKFGTALWTGLMTHHWEWKNFLEMHEYHDIFGTSLIAQFRRCHRITMAYSLVNLTECDKQEIRLEITGYGEVQNDQVCQMTLLFNRGTGMIRL